MIQINWADIKKDVQKQTWRIAKVTLQDDEAIYNAQEDDTASSIKFVMRFAEEGYSILVTKMREFISFTNSETSTDALDNAKATWTITLKDSEGVNERALAMLVHKFIVDYILHRWCNLWAQNSSNIFLTSYQALLNDIEEMVFCISFPVKAKRPDYPSYENKIEVEYE